MIVSRPRFALTTLLLLPLVGALPLCGRADDDAKEKAEARRQALQWNDSGIELRTQGKLREAIAAFEKAVSFDPTDETIGRNLGTAWNDEGVRLIEKESRTDDAISAFENAAKLLGSDATLRRNHASALDRRGHERLARRQFDAALADFGSAAALQPEMGRFPTSMAFVWFQRDDWERAARDLDEVVRRFPKEVDAWKLLAESRLRIGDPRGAVDAMRRAVELAPGRADLATRLAEMRSEADVEGEFVPGNSRHFQFHYPPDRKDLAAAADLVAGLLEEAHVRIGADFGFYPEGRTQVIFYEVEDFSALTRADEWVGALYDGKIRVPIRDFAKQRDTLRRTLLHEYTHRVVHALARGSCPTWLNEGLAQLSEEASLLDAESRLKKQPEKLLSAADLRGAFVGKADAARARVAYDQSLALTKYLVDQRGRSGVTRFLKAIGGFDAKPVSEAEAFQEEFRMTFEELLERWRLSIGIAER